MSLYILSSLSLIYNINIGKILITLKGMAIIYVSLISMLTDCKNHLNSHLLLAYCGIIYPKYIRRFENLTEFKNAVQQFDLVSLY